jgi:hypothetical protein
MDIVLKITSRGVRCYDQQSHAAYPSYSTVYVHLTANDFHSIITTSLLPAGYYFDKTLTTVCRFCMFIHIFGWGGSQKLKIVDL